MDPSSIFQSDIDEAMQRISLCINTLQFFRQVFDDFRSRVGDYFKKPEQKPPIYWTFHPNAVFQRLNEFIERLNLIEWSV